MLNFVLRGSEKHKFQAERGGECNLDDFLLIVTGEQQIGQIFFLLSLLGDRKGRKQIFLGYRDNLNGCFSIYCN